MSHPQPTSPFPSHSGQTFTRTAHTRIPPSLSPRRNPLPSPFVAVITGAGKGLGYHISLAYASAGATGLSISSRTLSDLDVLAKEIAKINPDIEVMKSVCDTTSDDSVRALEKEVRERFGGRLDVAVANAGVISRYVEGGDGESNLPIGLEQDADWARVLDINLGGTWRVAQTFLPLLRETVDGGQTLIVNTSLASHSTNSLLTPIAYNVSKLACNRLVEHIDADHRVRDGIHAYALHPGAVVTPQTVGHKAKGDVWGQILSDEEGLAGAFCIWLCKEKRAWLSGRYVSCNWDVEELEAKKDEIVKGDLLKFKMVV